MNFRETTISGSYIIELQKHIDERGFFARAGCADEFSLYGISFDFVQMNLSFNAKSGTLRGLHMQLPPNEEAKLVRCIQGEIWDVAIDLRATSPTYMKSFGIELTSDNRKAFYIPEGCAHGYLTRVDNSEVQYLTTARYAPDSEVSIIWNDEALNIKWPDQPELISEKDKTALKYTDILRLLSR